MSNPVRESVTNYIDEHGFDTITKHEDRLHEFADELYEQTEKFEVVPWVWDPHPTFEHDMSAEERLDLFMLGNTINFQFRDPESPEKYTCERMVINDDEPEPKQFGGAEGMWAALLNAYEQDPDVLTADYLASLEEPDVEALFPAATHVDMPMIPERTAILNEVGDALQANYGERFQDVVDAAEPRLYADGEGIIDHLVTDFPSFDDSHEIDGHDINLYKRAQLAVWMPLGHLQVLGEDDLLQVEDQHNFEMAADYHMPNILEYKGVMTDHNREHDAEGNPAPLTLVAGSPAETERRAASVAYGREIIDHLNETYDLDISGAELDGALFTGYKNAAEEAQPVHKTVSVDQNGTVAYGTTDY